MHELIDGLDGIEVVADDFVAVGCGNTEDEAVQNHDRNLDAFLQRCSTQGVKLNPQKVRLRLREVPFIGHIATDQGLCADPAKVRAITEMQMLQGFAVYCSTSASSSLTSPTSPNHCRN